MRKSVFHIHRTDGLGARLAALVHVMRFASELGAEVRMPWRSLCWPERDADADDWRFSDLFDRTSSDLRGVEILDNSEDASPRTQILDQEPIYQNPLRFGFQPAEIPFDKGEVVLAGSRILRLQGESDEKVTSDLRVAFRRLVPAASIRVALAQADALLDGASAIGVHVRRGDVLSSARAAVQALNGESLNGFDTKSFRNVMRALALRCAPVGAICSVLSEQAEEMKVLVLGEAPGTQIRIENLVASDRVVDLSSIRGHLTPIRAALFDLYLFTRMDVVIGGSSAFTRLAVETGLSRECRIEPSGAAMPWIEMFDEEVLEGLAISSEIAVATRAVFEEVVLAVAKRTDNLAERAAMLADRARRAGRS